MVLCLAPSIPASLHQSPLPLPNKPPSWRASPVLFLGHIYQVRQRHGLPHLHGRRERGPQPQLRVRLSTSPQQQAGPPGQALTLAVATRFDQATRCSWGRPCGVFAIAARRVPLFAGGEGESGVPGGFRGARIENFECRPAFCSAATNPVAGWTIIAAGRQRTAPVLLPRSARCFHNDARQAAGSSSFASFRRRLAPLVPPSA